jgi:hypothetical protein
MAGGADGVCIGMLRGGSRGVRMAVCAANSAAVRGAVGVEVRRVRDKYAHVLRSDGLRSCDGIGEQCAPADVRCA